MEVLVTGASGLLGHALAHRLASQGDTVRVLLRKPEQQSELFDDTSVDRFEGSLDDVQSLRAAAAGVDEIFHCAGTSTDWAKWDTFYSGNVSGVENLLKVCVAQPRLKRFLHVSSTDVYGYPRHVCHENAPPVDVGLPYNRSKIMGEKLVWAASKAGLPVTIVRPASIFGPRDNDFVVEIHEQLRQGQWQMPLISGGNSTGGWLFISNAVDGIVAAARSENTVGKAYNLRDETAETWRQYLDAFADEAGFPRTMLRLPFWFAYGMASSLEIVHRLCGWSSRPLLTRHTVYLMTRDAAFPIDRAKADFGFTSRVGFQEAIAESVAWVKTQDNIQRGLATVSR